MARWKLATAHYLNVPGVEWEYKENERGKKKIKTLKLPVPLLLDPNDPFDWNHFPTGNKDEGIIVVTNVAGDDDNDIVFIGEPTPDMIPLDDEAKALSASLAKKWQHPIDSLPGQFSQSLIDGFQGQIAEVLAAKEAKPAEVAGLSELMSTMAAVMKQNQDILAALAVAKTPEGQAARRA